MTSSLVCAAFLAVAISPEQVLTEVKDVYKEGGDFEASFSHVYVDKLRGKRREETGKLWATRDGKVRWSYLVPIRKDFVFDGSNAYFYEPDNTQVTIYESFRDSPLAQAMSFLWGQGDLRKVFDLKFCAKGCDAYLPGAIIIELWPKADLPTVDHSLLVVDPKTHRVRKSVVFDPLGNRTEYSLTDLNFGANVKAAKFDFKVPKGVSVIRVSATK